MKIKTSYEIANLLKTLSHCHLILVFLQRYMDVLRDLTRLRDHYYSVYLSKLEAKVTRQRKELAAREEALKKKLLKEEKRKVLVLFLK